VAALTGLLDACVLYSQTLRDLLLNLAFAITPQLSDRTGPTEETLSRNSC